MICSISGSPTQDPVLSPVSGHIFDRTLVETYIEQTGKDPINNQPLSTQDLVRINQPDSATASPIILTSIPNLLSQFQKEWDALAIELFTLRKQLKESREELSVALYHQDAAVRVAAKAVKERDEAKKALEDLAVSVAKGEYQESSNEAGEQEPIPQDLVISQDISNEIKEAHGVLFHEHKSNKKKPHFNSESSISLSLTENLDLGSIFESVTGFKTAMITSAKPKPKDPNTLLLSFDNDHAIVIDINKQEVVTKILVPKKKKLVSVNWLNDRPILAFEDGSIWHDGEIISSAKNLLKIITHPSLLIFITVHKQGFQIFHNSSPIFANFDLNFEATTAELHGDGVLLSIGGKDGCIYIYDISSGAQVSKLSAEDSLPVSDLKFASNGYWLITSFEAIDSFQPKLKVFDLRKESIVFAIDDVRFLNIDYSSQLIYLLKESEDKIEISYLRYFKKAKTWQLDDKEGLFVDKVGKLKKKQKTQIVSTFILDEIMAIVENSSQLKKIGVVLA